MDNDTVQDMEIQILLDALHQRYGYDFRNYSKVSLKRRILRCLSMCEFQNISEIIPKLLHDRLFLHRLIHELTVSVTDMFRDPTVYLALRKHVIPILRTYPFFNIWHAGCATGEEVYSFAILLHEEGLYDKARIYATDLDERVVQEAKDGTYSDNGLESYKKKYKKAGGKLAFSDYCHSKHGQIRMDAALKKNMVFSTHNLATDGVFAEINLILCRNVFIYFSTTLQSRVTELFAKSLVRGGFLCLGSQEFFSHSNRSDVFTSIASKEKIYRKRVSIG